MGDPGPFQRRGLEGLQFLHGGGQLLQDGGVPGLVQQHRGHQFQGVVPLARGPGGPQPRHQSGRQRLTGFVMDREPGDQGLVPRPQLVDLRGELYEVAGNRGSGARWVPDLGEQAVEGMAELVEHRDHVVPGQQAGRTLGGAGEIAGVRHHGKGTGQVRLIHHRGHPRPATLGGPGERIEDHRTQRGAVGLADLVHLGVRGETA